MIVLVIATGMRFRTYQIRVAEVSPAACRLAGPSVALALFEVLAMLAMLAYHVADGMLLFILLSILGK